VGRGDILREEFLALKDSINKKIEEAYTKNWDDFFIIGFFFTCIGVFMFYFFPFLNLWIAMLNVGFFNFGVYVVFTRGEDAKVE